MPQGEGTHLIRTELAVVAKYWENYYVTWLSHGSKKLKNQDPPDWWSGGL